MRIANSANLCANDSALFGSSHKFPRADYLRPRIVVAQTDKIHRWCGARSARSREEPAGALCAGLVRHHAAHRRNALMRGQRVDAFDRRLVFRER